VASTTRPKEVDPLGRTRASTVGGVRNSGGEGKKTKKKLPRTSAGRPSARQRRPATTLVNPGRQTVKPTGWRQINLEQVVRTSPGAAKIKEKIKSPARQAKNPPPSPDGNARSARAPTRTDHPAGIPDRPRVHPGKGLQRPCSPQQQQKQGQQQQQTPEGRF
jgi:hypothetical protein